MLQGKPFSERRQLSCLAKLLELNPTQTDILTIVFKIADDEGLLLMDTKDLKSMLQYVAENNAQYCPIEQLLRISHIVNGRYSAECAETHSRHPRFAL